MRVIKFRALTVKGQQRWVYGYYWKQKANSKHFFIDMTTNNYPLSIEVHPETVSQFTGLLDKNGVDVYEGDYDKDFQVVRWCDKRNGYAMSIYDFPTKEHICCHCYNCEGNYDISEVISELEIIGNLHEHKHLLV